MTNPTSIAPKGKIICPQCGDSANRVQRKLRDCSVSLVKPVKRYRCNFCDWMGVLPGADGQTG